MQICIIWGWLRHPGMPDKGEVLRKRDDLGHVTDIHSISPASLQLYTQGTEERIPDTFSLNHCLKTPMPGHQNMKFTIVIPYWHTSSASCEKKCLMLFSFALWSFLASDCCSSQLQLILCFMVFVALCLLPESAVLDGCPRMPVLVCQVPVLGTVVPRMPVQMVLASQVSVLQMTGAGDDGSSDSCLSVSHTVVLVIALWLLPIGGSLWSSFLTGVSCHTGVFFSL